MGMSIVVWNFMGWNAIARDENNIEFARVMHHHTKRAALRALRRRVKKTRPACDGHIFVRPKGLTP